MPVARFRASNQHCYCPAPSPEFLKSKHGGSAWQGATAAAFPSAADKQSRKSSDASQGSAPHHWGHSPTVPEQGEPSRSWGSSIFSQQSSDRPPSSSAAGASPKPSQEGPSASQAHQRPELDWSLTLHGAPGSGQGLRVPRWGPSGPWWALSAHSCCSTLEKTDFQAVWRNNGCRARTFSFLGNGRKFRPILSVPRSRKQSVSSMRCCNAHNFKSSYQKPENWPWEFPIRIQETDWFQQLSVGNFTDALEWNCFPFHYILNSK